MKKFILVLFIGVIFGSCHRDDPPAPNASHSTNTLTSLESDLVANWKLTKVEIYYFDTLVNSLTQNFTDTVYCHMWLKSTWYGSGQPANHYQCTGALGSCVDNIYEWYVTGNFLNGQGSQWIESITTTNLVLMDSTPDILNYQKNRYYYRK